jgi:hypothetical protein
MGSVDPVALFGTSTSNGRLMPRVQRRVYGSSKYPWLTSFLKYVVLTGGTGVIAWYAHPYLLDELAELLKLDYKVRRVSACDQDIALQLKRAVKTSHERR